MYSDSDLMSVYDFLRNTPEGHLRKMMVAGKMSNDHFMILMKVARSCSGEEFAKHAIAGDFPKMKSNAKEAPFKDSLWPIALGKFQELGLLAAGAKAA
jgi:hypothetical protein